MFRVSGGYHFGVHPNKDYCILGSDNRVPIYEAAALEIVPRTSC